MPVNDLLRHMLGNSIMRKKTEEEIVVALRKAQSVAASGGVKNVCRYIEL
jgi:hypothetical protein